MPVMQCSQCGYLIVDPSRPCQSCGHIGAQTPAQPAGQPYAPQPPVTDYTNAAGGNKLYRPERRLYAERELGRKRARTGKAGYAVAVVALIALMFYGFSAVERQRQIRQDEARAATARRRQEEAERSKREAAEHQRQINSIMGPQQNRSSAPVVPRTSSTPSTSSANRALTSDSTIGDWKRAARSEKLRACTVMIRTLEANARLMPGIRASSHAGELVACIDEATRDLSMADAENQSVTEFTALCVIAMGWGI